MTTAVSVAAFLARADAPFGVAMLMESKVEFALSAKQLLLALRLMEQFESQRVHLPFDPMLDAADFRFQIDLYFAVFGELANRVH